jgi:hypothetical protein
VKQEEGFSFVIFDVSYFLSGEDDKDENVGESDDEQADGKTIAVVPLADVQAMAMITVAWRRN